MDILLNNEEMVYNVILEYLNQNRPFRISEILPYITSRFTKASVNINENGVKEILTSLVKKKLLVEGSVLTKNELIINPKRKKIYFIIRDHPGIIFNKIIKLSKFSNYIVYWHLSMLIKFGCVKKAMVGKHQIFFTSSLDVKDAKLAYFTSKKKSIQIINFLRNNDIGITKTKLSTELNMHINTVIKYLENLEKLKIITREVITNKDLFFLKEEYF